MESIGDMKVTRLVDDNGKTIKSPKMSASETPQEVKMSDEEISQYLNAVANGKIQPTNPLELKYMTTFRRLVQETGLLQQRLGELSNESSKCKVALDTTIGKRDAFAGLLLEIELERKGKSSEAQ